MVCDPIEYRIFPKTQARNVLGWGYLYESWLLWSERLETGSPEKRENWGPIAELVGRTWPLRSDPTHALRPAWVLIDSQSTPKLTNKPNPWTPRPVDV